MRGAAPPPSTVRTVCHDGIIPSARGLRACSASEPWAVHPDCRIGGSSTRIAEQLGEST